MKKINAKSKKIWQGYYHLAFLAILLFLLFNLKDSLYWEHFKGDQRAYIATAMKLDKQGFSGYNLRNVDFVINNEEISFSENNKYKGNLLNAYDSEGMQCYDQPLFHAGPLLSYMIMFSHKFFEGDQPYKVSNAFKIKEISRGTIFQTQFYAAVLPVLFCFLFVTGVYLLGYLLIGPVPALIASFLIAITPTVIISGHQLWPDMLLSALIVYAVLFFVLFVRRHNFLFLTISAVFFGLALLTKISGVFIFPALFLYLWKLNNDKKLIETINPLIIFGLISFLICLPWYFTVWKNFGTPFYNISSPGISTTHEWFIFLKTRPWYTYFVTIPYQMPLYLLGYAAIFYAFINRNWKPENVLLISWFLFFFIPLNLLTHFSEMLGPDARYLIPLYPALALLSAVLINNIRERYLEKFSGKIAWGIVLLLLIVCAKWSLPMTNNEFFMNFYDNFLNVPF